MDKICKRIGHLDRDHKADCTRGKVYYHLIDNHLRGGMQKETVFELLGKPLYGLLTLLH